MVHRLTSACLTLIAIAGLNFSVSAQESILETMLSGCQTELVTYCSNVTPGEERLMACMYAHQDKLSRRCEFALYDGVVQLERAISGLRFAAGECAEDLQKFCSDVEEGDGRLVSCINEHQAEVSSTCTQAMEDVGLK